MPKKLASTPGKKTSQYKVGLLVESVLQKWRLLIADGGTVLFSHAHSIVLE